MGRACRTCAALVGAIAILSGCAVAPRLFQSTPGSNQFVGRELSASFTASGRVAARVIGETARGFSGGFTWRHRPDNDVIELLTPLGQIAGRMSVSGNRAEVETSDGRKTVAENPEQFFADNLGVALPLAALPNWMQGVPLAGTTYRAEADSKGRPTMLWQAGWQIQYSEYVDETPGARPARLQLNQGGVEARMIISEWSSP